jgi:hypothetical protein
MWINPKTNTRSSISTKRVNGTNHQVVKTSITKNELGFGLRYVSRVVVRLCDNVLLVVAAAATVLMLLGLRCDHTIARRCSLEISIRLPATFSC